MRLIFKNSFIHHLKSCVTFSDWKFWLNKRQWSFLKDLISEYSSHLWLLSTKMCLHCSNIKWTLWVNNRYADSQLLFKTLKTIVALITDELWPFLYTVQSFRGSNVKLFVLYTVLRSWYSGRKIGSRCRYLLKCVQPCMEIQEMSFYSESVTLMLRSGPVYDW